MTDFIELEDAIQTIISLGEEIKAVKILMEHIERETEKVKKDNAHMSACLKAIKKINKSQDMAIDALCERETE